MKLVNGEYVEETAEDIAQASIDAQPSPVTAKDVNAERDKRQSVPVPVQINETTGFYVDTDSKAQLAILAVTEMANISSDLGLTDLIDFTGADNVTRSLTPTEIKTMSVQVFQELARTHAVARVLKDSIPIPLNYKDDAYWV
jgi:hypothetical protein